MVLAAEAGDRTAMIYLAKAYESGEGLGFERLVSLGLSTAKFNKWFYADRC